MESAQPPEGTDRIERWTLMICSECGEQAGMSIHGHAPPAGWQWLDVEVVPADQLAAAVGAMYEIAEQAGLIDCDYDLIARLLDEHGDGR